MQMLRKTPPASRRKRLFCIDPLEERSLLAVTGFDTSLVDPAGKFSFDLSALHLEHRQFLQSHPNFDATFAPQNLNLNVQSNMVSVYAIAKGGETNQLATGLLSLGLTNGQAQGVVVAGYLPIESLDEMARLSSLQYAYPTYAAKTNAGATVSQADVASNVNTARSQFGLDGTGVTIGVISDSFNALGGAIADAATGDLPPLHQINVLQDIPFGSDEGRGMMQLIHDLAPGAQLAFHTGFISQLDFANGIEELSTEAGAQIIVDDIGWATAPWFQDGFIARAVDKVVADGTAYYSSAGNNANDSYTRSYIASRNFAAGAFESEDFAPAFRGGTLHRDIFKVVVPDRAGLALAMQWDQPFFSQTLPLDGTQPGSLSDYDIYIFDSNFDPFEPEPQGTVVAASNSNNLVTNGSGDPVEFLSFFNGADVSGDTFYVAVFKRFNPVVLNVASTDVPRAIPNDGNTLTSNLVVLNPGGVATNAIITDVNVRLQIDHEWDEDLTVSLVSPNGTVIELFANVGGSGNNFGTPGFMMGLDDEATLAVAEGNPPFANFYIPAEALSLFDGESPYGTWQLLITDNDSHASETPVPPNSGTLQRWSLQITTDADPTPNANILKILHWGGVPVPSIDGFASVSGSSTIIGHPNALGAQATGAVFYQNAPGFTGNPLVNEAFSSLGGTPIVFDTFGTRLATPEIRLKPDISAPDGTNTTFFPGPRTGLPFLDFDVEGDGFPNFFGTSAAAPHAAAIAALMRQAVPDAAPWEIYTAMQQSAIDMYGFGHDFLSGYGYVLADEAIKALGTLRRGSVEGTKFIDRDGDGVRDADEQGLPGFTMYLDMNLNGVRDEISQTFHSKTLPQQIIDALPIFGLTTTMQFPATVYGIPTSTLVDVDVLLTIEHDAVQDLDVFLISPTGRRIQLFADIGGNLDDFLGTILDSEASTSIAAGTAPYTGRYRPQESLVPLYNEDPNGIWWLEVTDDTTLNKGVIYDFGLAIRYLEPTATTDSQGQYKFSNLPIGSYTIAELPQNGWQQTTFSGAAAKPLMVTEIDAGNKDGFEIQNVSDSVLDTRGWFVAISDAPFGNINEFNSVVWQLPDSIGPREVLYRTDSPSDHYFGANIFWNTNNTRIGSGWVMIVDNNGKVVDWVGWGWTPDDIASFDVTVQGVHVKGLHGSWTGAGADRSGLGTLQRTGNKDTNTSSDFRWFNSPSMGEQNYLAGLVLPVASAVNSQNVTLIGNSLTLTGQDFGNRFVGANPKVVASSPAAISAAPLSFIDIVYSEPMNAGSFTLADIVSFTGPGGSLLASISGITPLLGGTVFRVNFTPQSADGTYTIVVGPDVTAADNNARVDQDGDGVPGEATDDRYSYSIVLGSAAIHGTTWHDVNGDGIRDPEDLGLAGWTLYVDANSNGDLDSGERTAVTDADGNYQFLNLPAGSYTIRQVVQPGWEQTFPLANAPQMVSVLAGEVVNDIDFGNQQTVVMALFANLGAVTNQWVGNLNLARRPENYRFTTATGGILTVAPRFSPGAGNVRITVYDAQMNVVATSNAGARLDLPTTAGATYNISIEGTNTNVDVLLANVVEQVGSTVTVHGTAGDDVFYFTTGAKHRITVNGASYEYDPATVTNIIFDGAGGNDYAILTGSAQADLVRFGPGTGKLFGPGFLVDVRAERIEVNSGGGVDSAVFEDSAGADTLVTGAAVSYMVGPGFANAAIGYQVVRATSTAGDDVAIMQDSAGNDTFVSTPAVAAFYGVGLDHEARGFRTVRARASSGNDTAWLYDSTSVDTLVTRPEWTSFQGAGFDHEARGFDVIRARASSGNDIAIMLDSAGDDTFVTTFEWASLKGAGFDHEARGFQTVRGRASSGNDLAVMYDSTGNDTLVTRPEWTALQGPGFDHEARGFGVIRARATAGGFDQAIMLDSAGNDSFVARPEAAQMIGSGFDHEARGFESVRGVASTGYDRAVLIDSVLDDRLTVRRDYAAVQNAHWLAWAVNFDELTARKENGGNNTKVVDAAIGYLFNDRWS
ncbi:MAG: proprotein convertase P-domain-containing protein [Pirellulales bacterium]|nr:proprotein convertase P-domain-containing protein [Pirellulales bacterium]